MIWYVRGRHITFEEDWLSDTKLALNMRAVAGRITPRFNKNELDRLYREYKDFEYRSGKLNVSDAITRAANKETLSHYGLVELSSCKLRNQDRRIIKHLDVRPYWCPVPGIAILWGPSGPVGKILCV